jgi:oligopeptide transport system ATP-binding protein
MVKKLRSELGMAVVWITHDLGIIANLAQRVIVMYGGFFIEEAPVKELFRNPQHPYTLGLLGSLPRMDRDVTEPLDTIEGLPPVLKEVPSYCPFAPRCKFVMEQCRHSNPALREIAPGHRVACWLNTGSPSL